MFVNGWPKPTADFPGYQTRPAPSALPPYLTCPAREGLLGSHSPWLRKPQLDSTPCFLPAITDIVSSVLQAAEKPVCGGTEAGEGSS